MNGPIWNVAAETRPHEQQAGVQLQGVQRALAWTLEHSPMYRERLRGAGVTPDAVRSLADFSARVPLTSKNDLRDAMDRHGTALPHLCVPREDIVLSGPSAGTSGRQTYQAFDAQDLDTNVEMIARAYWSSGLRPGDVLHFMVTPFTPAADIFRIAAQRIGVKWIIRDSHEPGHVPRYVEVARALAPSFLWAGVATLRAMAQHAAGGRPAALQARHPDGRRARARGARGVQAHARHRGQHPVRPGLGLQPVQHRMQRPRRRTLAWRRPDPGRADRSRHRGSGARGSGRRAGHHRLLPPRHTAPALAHRGHGEDACRRVQLRAHDAPLHAAGQAREPGAGGRRLDLSLTRSKRRCRAAPTGAISNSRWCAGRTRLRRSRCVCCGR